MSFLSREPWLPAVSKPDLCSRPLSSLACFQAAPWACLQEGPCGELLGLIRHQHHKWAHTAHWGPELGWHSSFFSPVRQEILPLYHLFPSTQPLWGKTQFFPCGREYLRISGVIGAQGTLCLVAVPPLPSPSPPPHRASCKRNGWHMERPD